MDVGPMVDSKAATRIALRRSAMHRRTADELGEKIVARETGLEPAASGVTGQKIPFVFIER